MDPKDLLNRNLENEFIFSATRSSGPGGQNVNKVNTRVELRFSLSSTALFTEEEKSIISRKLKNKINKEGEIILISQSERTQQMNKNEVTRKFYDLIARALTKQKKRRSTRPTLTSKIKRLENKHYRGIIKKLRKDSDETAE
jgi:ribosome-associated protein